MVGNGLLRECHVWLEVCCRPNVNDTLTESRGVDSRFFEVGTPRHKQPTFALRPMFEVVGLLVLLKEIFSELQGRSQIPGERTNHLTRCRNGETKKTYMYIYICVFLADT